MYDKKTIKIRWARHAAQIEGVTKCKMLCQENVKEPFAKPRYRRKEVTKMDIKKCLGLV